MWWVNAWFDEMAALFIACIVLVLVISFGLGFACGWYVAKHDFHFRSPVVVETPK